MEIPQVEVFPLVAGGGPLRVVVSRAVAPAHTDAVEREWARLLAKNPRYFDGPLLSVMNLGMAGAVSDVLDGGPDSGQADHGALATNEIIVRRDRFSRLAVQPAVQTGVRILSVTGVLTARDRAGAEHVLLGRRGKGTRIYDGMWELGPSGGLSEPPVAVDVLDEGAVFSHLADEISEEVGLHVERGTPVGVARDHFAMSDDIVFVCDVGSLEEVRSRSGPTNWEYSETAWVAVREVAAFDAAHAGEIIAPARAIFRGLGWV